MAEADPATTHDLTPSTPTTPAHAPTHIFTPDSPPIPRSASSSTLCSESDDSTSIASSASAMNRKFKIPDAWRPSIMYCIQQPNDEERMKCLEPHIRNEMVRDLVSQMFAFEPKPKKQFVTEVAQQLVKKYVFLKDTGPGVSAYVS